jgi:hypothetical protein
VWPVCVVEDRRRLQEEGEIHVALPDTDTFRGAALPRDPSADLDVAEH